MPELGRLKEFGELDQEICFGPVDCDMSTDHLSAYSHGQLDTQVRNLGR